MTESPFPGGAVQHVPHHGGQQLRHGRGSHRRRQKRVRHLFFENVFFVAFFLRFREVRRKSDLETDEILCLFVCFVLGTEN